MSLFEPDVPAPAEPKASGPHISPQSQLLAALSLAVTGLGIQVMTTTAVATCQRDTDATVSCVLDKRMFFDTLSFGSERVAGVKDVRTVATRAGRRAGASDATRVVLVGAQGERSLGSSISSASAYAVVRSFKQHLRNGDSHFQVALRPVGWLWLARMFMLSVGLLGVVLLIAFMFGARLPTGGHSSLS
jgi:hypothetical protein